MDPAVLLSFPDASRNIPFNAPTTGFAAEAQRQQEAAQAFDPGWEHPYLRPLPRTALPPLPPLSPSQEAGLERLVTLLAQGTRHVSLAGAAGTGKTMLTRALLERLPRATAIRTVTRWTADGLPRVANTTFPATLAAPTHKAKRRLMEATGRTAATVHSLAYGGAEEVEGEEDRVDAEVVGNDAGGAAPPRGRPRKTQLVFRRRADKIATGPVVLVDEASMVNQTIRDDLEAVLHDDVQTVAVGDHCQLPPVEGAPGYDLAHADCVLTEVHRQAAGNPILACATEIREARCELTPLLARKHGLTYGSWTWREVAESYARRPELVTLVGTNRTRVGLNGVVRKALGLPGMADGPQPRERVVALSTGGGLCNGDEAVVLHVEPDAVVVPGSDEDFVLDWVYLALPGNVREAVLVCRSAWADPDPALSGKLPKALFAALRAMGETGWQARDDAARIRACLVALAPGYAITVHKGQGSQWTHGIVVLEWTPGDRSEAWRHRYTALTRISQRAVVARLEG